VKREFQGEKNHYYQGQKNTLNQVKKSLPIKTLCSKGGRTPAIRTFEGPSQITSTQDSSFNPEYQPFKSKIKTLKTEIKSKDFTVVHL